jgi:predicted enzyme related to lactoylglutathione lyase
MKFSGVMIGTEQPKKLADFYRKVLGKPTWDEGGNNWYTWVNGPSGFSIGPHSEVKGKSTAPERLIINFETEAVQSEFERIKDLGAKVIAKPYQPDPAQQMWIATFADPDGNYFQLMSPWSEG